jgi:hypothetical protein
VFTQKVRSRELDQLTKNSWEIQEFPDNLKAPKKQRKRKELLPTKTLDDLLSRLRNAVAHHRVKFFGPDPEGRDYENVTIEFHDQINDEVETQPYWKASIKAEDLRGFCFELFDLIDETLD